MTNPPGRPPVGKVYEVRLPPDLADAVRHAAKAAKVSAAEIHRRALVEYLGPNRDAAEAMATAIMNHDWGIAEPGELRAALDRWQELSPAWTPTP